MFGVVLTLEKYSLAGRPPHLSSPSVRFLSSAKSRFLMAKLPAAKMPATSRTVSISDTNSSAPPRMAPTPMRALLVVGCLCEMAEPHSISQLARCPQSIADQEDEAYR